MARDWTILLLALFLVMACVKKNITRRMTYLTTDHISVDYVFTYNHKLCLTQAELEKIRDKDKSKNIEMHSVVCIEKEECVGLYEYQILNKPSISRDHGVRCYFLKFENTIELSEQDSVAKKKILEDFYLKYGSGLTFKERNTISKAFLRGCRMVGGL